MLRQTTAGLNSRPTPSPATLTTTKTSSSEPDTSGGTDSGYASQVTTPGKGTPEASSDHTSVHKVVLPPPKLFQRKVTRLRPFDTEIPEAVRNRFCDLKELFDKPLYEYLSKERVSVGSIAMRLKVLGKTEETAKPWVVILCDQSISKLVKQYFNQPQVKEQFQTCNTDPELPSLDILIHDKPPKPRAVVEFDGVDGYTNANINLTLCGTLIKASSSNDGSVATLGGVVKVSYTSGRSMLYGMTVGHLFTDDRSETHTSILSGAEDDSRSEIADEENSAADITEEFILDLDFEEGDATLEAEAATTQPEAPADPAQNSSWSRLGYGIVPPVAHRNLDWALVDIEDKERYQPNLLPSRYGIPPVELRQLSNSEACISEKKVVVVSGRNELKQGNLSSFASFLLLAPGSTFLQTYTLTVTDGSDIRDGNSGSWVVDNSTHEVFGYLVASDVFQDGYVIPLDASLQDMKMQLSAESVCLPTRDEVYSWHASEWHGKHTNHLNPHPQSMLSVFSFGSSQSSIQNPIEVHPEDTPLTDPENFEDRFNDLPKYPLKDVPVTVSDNNFWEDTPEDIPVTTFNDDSREINPNPPMEDFGANVDDESNLLHPKGSKNLGGLEPINGGRSVHITKPYEHRQQKRNEPKQENDNSRYTGAGAPRTLGVRLKPNFRPDMPASALTSQAMTQFEEQPDDNFQPLDDRVTEYRKSSPILGEQKSVKQYHNEMAGSLKDWSDKWERLKRSAGREKV